MFLDPFVDTHDSILELLGSWAVHRHRGVIIDNFIFFLHYRVSATLFFVASILVTTGIYIADPIECISDPEVIDVIDAYCWVNSTFTIPRSGNSSSTLLTPHPGVTSSQNGGSSKFHNYYQWVCYILVFQAMAFYLPRGLWKTWEGGKVRQLLSKVQKSFHEKSNEEESFSANSKLIVDYFDKKLWTHGTYFYKLFLCEILNFIIVLGQMYCATFTNFKFSDALHYMTTNDPLEREDQVAQIFPKVTKCVFNTFGPSGNIVGHDALCILQFNVINEKIYLGMWLWLFFVGSFSAIMLIYRLLILFIPTFRIMILKQSTKYTDIHSFRVLRDNLSVGDWMLLRNLSKNLDLLQFTQVVKSLELQFDSNNYI